MLLWAETMILWLFLKKNGPTMASFCLFSFFQILQKKTVGVSGIRTRIVGF